ncbi:MAG: hypothetical protein KDK29_05635 [Sedimentitalea sp.]|nr:hypothetical protein [Sedimentitalea sp.]
MADSKKTDPDPKTEPSQGAPYKLEPSAEIADPATEPDAHDTPEVDTDADKGETPTAPDAAAEGPDTPWTAETREVPEPPKPAAEEAETPAADTVRPADASPPAPPERVVETVVEKRGGFGAALIGGLIAAVLAFLALRSDVLDPVLPDSLKRPDTAAELAALESRLAEQSASLAALGERVGALDIPDAAEIDAAVTEQTSAIAGQLPPLAARIDTLSGQFSDLTARLDPLEARLTDLEKRPIDQGVSEAAIAAYERELAALQTAMASQRAEVEAMVQNAQAMKAESDEMRAKAAAAAALAETVAAATRLQVAVEAGSPFAADLGALTAAGIEAPEVLTRTAAEGVATLATLRAGFPPAAREALAAARAAGEAGDASLGAFLQRQLNVRSVEPRAGDDPDAILSRAEAALTAGDLPSTLTEIAALPQPALDAMSNWIDLARTRQDAIAAADTLAESLNTN